MAKKKPPKKKAPPSKGKPKKVPKVEAPKTEKPKPVLPARELSSEKTKKVIEEIAARLVRMGKEQTFLTPGPRQIEEALTAAHEGECPLRLEDLLRAYDYNFVSDVGGICRTINVPSGRIAGTFWPKFAINPPPKSRMMIVLTGEDRPRSIAAIAMKIPSPDPKSKERTGYEGRKGKGGAVSSGGGASRSRGKEMRIKLLYSGKNPRKEGTHGWRSWNLLKDGMLLSEALKAGARMNDIRWDEAKKHLELNEVT